MNVDWKLIEDPKEKYKAYLCSREWTEKRKAVLERANGVCERCGLGRVDEIHHSTYARLFRELLDDLQGLCSACHRFVGNHSEFDPAGLGSFRSSPRNLEAETALLSCMIRMNEVLDDVSTIVSPQDFFGEAHRRIASAIFALHKAGVVAIDAVTVAEELLRRGSTPELISASLKQIIEVPTITSNAVDYAQIIRSKACLRRVILEFSKIIDRAYTANEQEVIEDAEKAVFALTQGRGEGDVDSLANAVVEMLGELDRRQKIEGSLAGITTGFVDLDRQIHGFQPGELIILAARPSIGKTALACSFLRTRATTLYVSLEQSRTELSERILVSESGIDGSVLRSGEITDYDNEHLALTAKDLSSWPVFIDDASSRTVSDIRSIARRLRRRDELQLIIVDYLQLLVPDDTRLPREQQVSGITRQLKCLARELKIPVIAISQLNRGVEMREDKRPRLGDLRESGAIEQDADLVIFLHRPDAYDPEDRPGEAEVIIAKHRNGPTGIVRLSWMAKYLRFEDYTPNPDNDFNL